MFEKIVLVIRKTRLEELIIRYGSERQARFHIEQNGGDFQQYAAEHSAYKGAIELVRPILASTNDLKLQIIERQLVKSYLFSNKDLIVTLGQDGLVANTAKYIGSQPLIAINPDPERYDGVLMPFLPEDIKSALRHALDGNLPITRITLGEAKFSDGQRLLAFNDFFIGAKTHVSARYQITHQKRTEKQSSSGIIISTGAGSTGWLSSVLNMANGIATACGGKKVNSPNLTWDAKRLVFAVREPFVSKTSKAETVFGYIDEGQNLTVDSHMPSEGVVFSDGVEEDFVNFNSGATVTIGPANQQVCLAGKP